MKFILSFPRKPVEEILTLLRQEGYKWNSEFCCWWKTVNSLQSLLCEKGWLESHQDLLSAARPDIRLLSDDFHKVGREYFEREGKVYFWTDIAKNIQKWSDQF